MRINFFLFIADFFCPHLGSCFFFHYVSAKFHLWPSSGDLPRPRIGMLSLVTVYDKQQLWKAVITGDTVTRLSIPIRGRRKSPEEGQKWNLAET